MKDFGAYIGYQVVLRDILNYNLIFVQFFYSKTIYRLYMLSILIFIATRTIIIIIYAMNTYEVRTEGLFFYD